MGEWSFSVSDDAENKDEWKPEREGNRRFYERWFAAQVQAYERGLGWVFWTCKAALGD